MKKNIKSFFGVLSAMTMVMAACGEKDNDLRQEVEEQVAESYQEEEDQEELAETEDSYVLSTQVEAGAYVSLETLQAYIEEMHGTATWAIRKGGQDVFQIVGLRADESGAMQSADFNGLEFLYEDKKAKSSVMVHSDCEALMDPDNDELVFFSTREEPKTTFETAGGMYYAVPLLFERDTKEPEKDKVYENKVYARSVIEQNVEWKRLDNMRNLKINGIAPEDTDSKYFIDGETHRDYLVNDIGVIYEVPEMSKYVYRIVDTAEEISITGELGATLYEAQVKPAILFTQFHDSTAELTYTLSPNGYAVYDVKSFYRDHADYGENKNDGSTKRLVLGNSRYLGFLTH